MNPAQDTFEIVVEHTTRSTTLSRLLCHGSMRPHHHPRRRGTSSVTAVAVVTWGGKKPVKAPPRRVQRLLNPAAPEGDRSDQIARSFLMAIGEGAGHRSAK